MRRGSRRRRAAAFTLLEMMAVVVLMAVVLGVAVDFYLDLSRASYAATTETGGARRALVLLDRVARDLEGTVLLQKPPEVDPLEFPWIFLAEASSPDAGAERVKFVRRGRTPRSSDLPESDLELVAWITDEGPDGGLELRRASWTQLPEGLDRRFPNAEQSDLVAAGLATFGIRFLGEDGQWSGRWDSSTIADAGALPIAAEIELAFATDEEGVVDGPYTRKVLLPLRPLDLAKKLEEAKALAGADVEVKDEDGDGDIDEDDQAIAEERAKEEQKNDDGEAGSEITLSACMALDPGVNAAVEGLLANGGSQADVVRSLLSLPVAQAAQLAGVAIPEACQ